LLKTDIGGQRLKKDFNQKQLNYLRKQTKRIQHVHTDVISVMLQFSAHFQMVMLKLKTGYLKKQCIKSGIKHHFRSTRCDINLQ